MLTKNQIIQARNWMYSRPDSHLHDGYNRLRRHMILAGVDLPMEMPSRGEQPCDTEKFLLLVYFDVIEEFAREAREEELRRFNEMSRAEQVAWCMANDPIMAAA
jgi:hypothetical protein